MQTTKRTNSPSCWPSIPRGRFNRRARTQRYRRRGRRPRHRGSIRVARRLWDSGRAASLASAARGPSTCRGVGNCRKRWSSDRHIAPLATTGDVALGPLLFRAAIDNTRRPQLRLGAGTQSGEWRLDVVPCAAAVGSGRRLPRCRRSRDPARVFRRIFRGSAVQPRHRRDASATRRCDPQAISRRRHCPRRASRCARVATRRSGRWRAYWSPGQDGRGARLVHVRPIPEAAVVVNVTR